MYERNGDFVKCKVSNMIETTMNSKYNVQTTLLEWIIAKLEKKKQLLNVICTKPSVPLSKYYFDKEIISCVAMFVQLLILNT